MPVSTFILGSETYFIGIASSVYTAMAYCFSWKSLIKVVQNQKSKIQYI
ncbi:UDP-N-acetylglucosamine pyrophosphorylase [Tolypothrix sp. PCC 7601]|nr:UDP-N-acetylglucosamine pyrophosphorylase [Tolypothrix sp. PCC 7601]